jgi:hypothetical protein
VDDAAESSWISLAETPSLLARSTSSAPAWGSAASALPAALALRIDRSPFFNASIVAGACSATSAVSKSRIASPTVMPVVAANQCAELRWPRPCHRLVWATRRAANANPADAACSRSENTVTMSMASRAMTTSGSKPATTEPTSASREANGRTPTPTGRGSSVIVVSSP